MGQGERASRQDMEATRAMMAEEMSMVEERVQESPRGAERVQETAGEVKSTVDSMMERYAQVQETVEEAKSTIDQLFEDVESIMAKTGDYVKPIADFIDQVKQNPWTMLGSAILLGYTLYSLQSEESSYSKSSEEESLRRQEQMARYSRVRFNFHQSIPEGERIRFLNDVRQAIQEAEAELERAASLGEVR